jgi:hypothetical protein
MSEQQITLVLQGTVNTPEARQADIDRLERVEIKIDEIGKLLGRIARALLLPKPAYHEPAPPAVQSATVEGGF